MKGISSVWSAAVDSANSVSIAKAPGSSPSWSPYRFRQIDRLRPAAPHLAGGHTAWLLTPGCVPEACQLSEAKPRSKPSAMHSYGADHECGQWGGIGSIFRCFPWTSSVVRDQPLCKPVSKADAEKLGFHLWLQEIIALLGFIGTMDRSSLIAAAPRRDVFYLLLLGVVASLSPYPSLEVKLRPNWLLALHPRATPSATAVVKRSPRFSQRRSQAPRRKV